MSDDGEWWPPILGWALGLGGSEQGARWLTAPPPHPADEKEPEVEYRTVTVSTDRKVSDVYDIEERLGS